MIGFDFQETPKRRMREVGDAADDQISMSLNDELTFCL